MNFLKYQSISLYKEKNPVINNLTIVGNQFFAMNRTTVCTMVKLDSYMHTYICMHICIKLTKQRVCQNLSDEIRSYRYNNTSIISLFISCPPSLTCINIKRLHNNALFLQRYCLTEYFIMVLSLLIK